MACVKDVRRVVHRAAQSGEAFSARAPTVWEMAAVRFGLKARDDLRSSSWSVHGGGDSSVYVINRDVGHAMKVSLHPHDPNKPGGDYRVAWTSEYWQGELLPPETPRLMADWHADDGRLPDAPLRMGFCVLLGRFSLGLYPPLDDPDAARRQQQRFSRVEWIEELPDPGFAWQVTVLIGDPRCHLTGTPGRNGMGAQKVGSFVLPDESEVWLVRHVQQLDEGYRDVFERGLTIAVEKLGKRESPGVYRSLVLTSRDGLHGFIDTALSFGGSDADFDV